VCPSIEIRDRWLWKGRLVNDFIRRRNNRPRSNPMLVVREVFAEGHAGFTREHLDYIREMANRTGFSVIEPAPKSDDVATIKLNVRMTNPVFKALIEDHLS
jgi:hypothetical protein